MAKKRVVVMGGGTGTFTVLSGLRRYPVDLSAIVTMADDGGSSGLLRDELGVLPPGDVRQALVALSEESQLLRNLFNYRFNKGTLKGHSFGNLFLTALEKTSGSFATAVSEASKILRIRGTVIPVTLDNVRLNARLSDGTIIRGETNIDIPSKRRAPIARVWLTPKARLNPAARATILAADLVVIGPGDLYTSIIPNLLVSGMADALSKARGRVAYVANLMTKRGETDGFTAHEFVNRLANYLKPGTLDYVLFNTGKPSSALLKRYRAKGADFITPPSVAGGDLRRASSPEPICVLENLLDGDGLIRHNSERLAAALMKLIV